MTLQLYMSDLMTERGASAEADVQIICDNHAHHNGSSFRILGEHRHNSDEQQVDGQQSCRRPRRSRSNSFNNLMTGFGASCRRMVCRWDCMTHDSTRSQSQLTVPIRYAEKDDPTSPASSEASSSREIQLSETNKTETWLEGREDYETGNFHQTVKPKPAGPLHHLKLHLPKLQRRVGGQASSSICRLETPRSYNVERVISPAEKDGNRHWGE